MAAVTQCLDLLNQAEVDANSALVDLAGGASQAAGGSIISDVLPIVDADILLSTVLADALICLSLLFNVFLSPTGQTPDQVCGTLSSTGSTATTLPPTVSPTGTSMPSSTVVAPISTATSSGKLPAGWPSESTFLGDSCLSCSLTDYFTTIQLLATQDNCVSLSAQMTDGFELAPSLLRRKQQIPRTVRCLGLIVQSRRSHRKRCLL